MASPALLQPAAPRYLGAILLEHVELSAAHTGLNNSAICSKDKFKCALGTREKLVISIFNTHARTRKAIYSHIDHLKARARCEYDTVTTADKKYLERQLDYTTHEHSAIFDEEASYGNVNVLEICWKCN